MSFAFAETGKLSVIRSGSLLIAGSLAIWVQQSLERVATAALSVERRPTLEN